MFCVQRHQMCINDGNWRRSWVCAFGASKENIELNGAHCKGTYTVEGWVGRHHLQLHAAIDPSQLDISTPKQLQETRPQMGKANRRICGVSEEAASVPQNPEKVALRMVPVILEEKMG